MKNIYKVLFWRARGIPLPRPTCREQGLAAKGFTPPFLKTDVLTSERAGFTLIEVLMVIVILGVMAGLAIPSYNNTVEQSRANEARVNLTVIYTAEKIYKINSSNGEFWGPGSDPTITNINATLNIDLATPQFYRITSITAAGSGATATFTARATRPAGSGSWAGKWAEINQAGSYTTGGP